MKAVIFIAGFALGSAVFYGYGALDRGTSETYRADELEHRDDERTILRRLAEAPLVGMQVAEAEKMLRELGLHDFTKGGEERTFIVLGAGVVVEAENGVVTRIQDDCDRLGDCA